MPPKRKRPQPAPESDPEPEPASSPGLEEEPDDVDAPDPSSLFYNITFSAYRVSPLHVGRDTLDAPYFQTLAKRLRDTLVGDVVRGVQVGLASDDGTLGRAGMLESVVWKWVAISDLLGDNTGGGARDGSDEEEDDDDLAGSAAKSHKNRARRRDPAAKALTVELQYENAAFSALLLPEFFSSASPDSHGAWTSHSSIPAPPKPDTNAQGRKFHHLPLLLLRMPAPLKSVLIDFLCRTFDARVSPLRLGTRTLVSSWEGWLARSGTSTLRRLNKDVALTLGFHIEPPAPGDGGTGGPDAQREHVAERKPGKQSQQLGLKTLDLIIAAPDVHRFLRAGANIASSNQSKGSGTDGRDASAAPAPLSPSRRRKLAGGLDEEGWGWRAASDPSASAAPEPHPFTEAVRAYLDRHLALDLFHPGVRVLKIACDGFSISEGRLKLFRPTSHGAGHAAWHLVGELVEKARGRTDWMSVTFA